MSFSTGLHPPIPQNEVRRHDSLYYADGDIILFSLPVDGVITAFRVDTIFLSRHSLVFKEMLSFPSPEHVEKYDNVPLVRLQDHAAHLAPFLIALYDPTSIPFKKLEYDTIAQIEWPLKLSIKYAVEKLRKRIVDHLLEDWPADLAKWDIHEADIHVMTKHYVVYEENLVDPNVDIPNDYSIDHVLPEPCDVIRLAHECDIPQILPAAFYHLSRIPPHLGDLDYLPSRNEPGYREWQAYICHPGRRARFRLLSLPDLMRLFKGTPSVCQMATHLLCSARKDIRSCCFDNAQEEHFLKTGELVKKYHDAMQSRRDPLAVLSEDLVPPDALCVGCRINFLFQLKACRAELWNSLPSLFGLLETVRHDLPPKSRGEV